jgi:hypothetical protein
MAVFRCGTVLKIVVCRLEVSSMRLGCLVGPTNLFYVARKLVKMCAGTASKIFFIFR